MREFKRRDVLVLSAASAGLSIPAKFAASQTWSEKYNRSQVSEGAKVDVAGMEPGQQLMLKLGGTFVAVRYRTSAEIQQARATRVSELPDALARNANLLPDAPATDENRTIDEDGKWLVYRPICPHLSVVTLPARKPIDGKENWINCPVHGGRFDAAGRIIGGPPLQNLSIPPAKFISDSILEVYSHNPFAYEQQVREAHPSDW